MKWYHRLKHLRMRYPLMLTLTLRPGPDAAALIDLALRSFRQLRRAWKFPCGIYGVEVLPNRLGWYVHLHCLMDYGNWLDMPELQRQWQALTGSYIGHVRRVDRHRLKLAVLEVVKYITKGFGSARLAPGQVDELDRAVKHRRLVSTWGKLELVPSLLDTQETTLPGLRCLSCGSRLSFVCRLAFGHVAGVPRYDFAAAARAGPSALTVSP